MLESLDRLSSVMRCVTCVYIMMVLVLFSPSAIATNGDIFKKGVTYKASTYNRHPSEYGHEDEKDVVDINVGWRSYDCNYPIVAPESGGKVSIRYRDDRGWGNAIEWKKGDEVLFMAHLSRFGKTGAVDSGEVIGFIGATGNSDGCHLHIERDGGHLYLSGKRVFPATHPKSIEYKSNGPLASPRLRVYDFWRRMDPIYSSNRSGVSNFDAQFKIKNEARETVQIDDVAIAVLRQGNLVFDCWRKGAITTIRPGGVFETGVKRCEIYNPGIYSVEARIKVNGRWKTYGTLPFSVKDSSAILGDCDPTKKSTADKIFRYIEKKYSFWFKSGSITYKYVVSGTPTYYRYYKASNSYLWIWRDGHLWYRIGVGSWRRSNTVSDWCKAASVGD